MNAEQRTNNKELEKRGRELEKQLKLAQMKVVALNTVIDIAEKDYKLEIRKKYGPSSNRTDADVPAPMQGGDLLTVWE